VTGSRDRLDAPVSRTILIGMACHKLTIAAIACGIITGALSTSGVRGGQGHSPVAPSISAPLQKYLSRTARRTVRDAMLNREAYEPSYVPAGLTSVNGEAVVRLWQDGHLRAMGVGGPGPVVYCVTQAASVAAAALQRSDASISAGDVAGMSLEIEIAGMPVPIQFDGDWTAVGVLSDVVEPGVHGVIVIGKNKGRRVYPSELIWRGFELHEALEGLAQATQIDPKKNKDTKLERFATIHWVQPRSGADALQLVRGMVYQGDDTVSLQGVSRAIDQLLEYSLYRQRRDGRFSYEFRPGADVYSDKDHLLRQLFATASVSYCAKVTGRDAARAAADLSLAYHRQGLAPLVGVDGAAFMATADQDNPLGATALMCLALAVHPQPEKYAAVRKQLVLGMLSLQRESGMFLTAFPPSVKLNEQDYFPGEALFALASEYALSRSPEILAAFDRALGFYREYFRANRSPAFLSWQVQAFALMAEQTDRRDFADFVFELADPIVDAQLTNSPWPELYGAVKFGRNEQAGAATAANLSAVCDALVLARKFGDRERELRYVNVVRGGVRFVMQLQFREAEAFFVRSPRDVLGGVRTSPSLNRLRIDHAFHGLIALLKARRVLFSS
jgi:AMMECR1 domain-containing protein